MVGNILLPCFVSSIHLQHCDSCSKEDLTGDVKAKRVVLSGERSHSDGEEVSLPLLSGTVGDGKGSSFCTKIQ